MNVWTIVVAAGSGSRFGGAKQFARLANATVLDRSVATAARATDGVVVVLARGATWSSPLGVTVVSGGATRSDSVRAGLEVVPDHADVIVVHDAARPLATPHLYRAVVDAVLAGADAAIPATTVSDTLKRVERGVVTATVDRADLVAVQTPQAFRAPMLRRAHESSGDATDDAGLVEAIGGRVVIVDGEPRIFKITIAADLELAAALLEGA